MQEIDLTELDELTEEHLGFSALSDGLGFQQNHKKVQVETAPAQAPTPVIRKQEPPTNSSTATAPTGAIAAGPALPARQQPKIVFAKKNLAEAPAPSIADPGASPATRSAAFVLDLALAFAPWALAFLYLVPVSARAHWLLLEGKSLTGLVAAYLFVYFLLSESLGGQSPGKMIWGLQIVEDDKYQKPIGFKSALSRLVLFIPAFAALGLGLVSSFWDLKLRALHDKFTGTIVRRA